MKKSKISVTVWNEFVHEQEKSELGNFIRKIYPDGIHRYLSTALAANELEFNAVSLDQPEQGLPDELLNRTDVLLWWGHCAHSLVDDALVERIAARVRLGMGLSVLHS